MVKIIKDFFKNEVKMKRNISKLCLSSIIVLIVISLALAGCASTVTSSSGTTITDTSAADPNQVICRNSRFQPNTLTVKVGTTVTWINQDNFIHTVTSGTSPSEKSGLFDSGDLSGGETFSFTFDQPGTYDYFCVPHYSMGMIGKIIVTE